MTLPLLTNVYPFSLVRRKMLAEPMEMDEVIKIAQSGEFESAWGHANTISAVNEKLGADITPREPRPAVILDEDNFPTLYGQTTFPRFMDKNSRRSFSSVPILSPAFARP